MKEPTKYYSAKQESNLAQKLGWEVVSGSGARPCVPGDVISDEWLGECKTHETKSSIFFDLEVWKKIQDEAVFKHRKPVLFVDDGSQDENNTWVLCYQSSLNLSSSLTSEPNFKIRKNISFKSDNGKQFLKEITKGNCGGFFDSSVYTYKWGDFEVAFMPFVTFKELLQK